VIRVQTLNLHFSEVRITPFSEEALRAVKKVPGREWDPSERVWLIPTKTVHGAVRRLHEAGETVVVDGVGYDPVRAVEESNVFIPLMAALPEHLTDRVFAALVEVFATTNGGDDEARLFAQLFDAVDLMQKEAKVTAKVEERTTRPKGKPPAKPKPIVWHTRAQTEMKPVRRLVRREAS
jgi:hypothetical protein